MLKNVPAFFVILIILIVILSVMCAFQVRFTETAVVTRFDRVLNVIEPNEAGFHWRAPWPIDRVHRYDARLRSFETEFRQLGTQDQKTVILTAYAQWRIVDARKFLENVGQEDTAAKKIRDLLDNEVSEVMRGYDLKQLVNVDPAQSKFEEIEGQFLGGIVDRAQVDYGIQVVSVGIKRLGLPEDVTKEVFNRMKEDRQKEIKELTAQGESKARQIRADANEKAQRIIARAEAYAKMVEGQGDAQAATYYQTFAENRHLSDFLKKLETIEQIFEAGQITLVLDAAKLAPFDLLTAVGRPEKLAPQGSEGGSSDASAAADTLGGVVSDLSEQETSASEN